LRPSPAAANAGGVLLPLPACAMPPSAPTPMLSPAPPPTAALCLPSVGVRLPAGGSGKPGNGPASLVCVWCGAVREHESGVAPLRPQPSLSSTHSPAQHAQAQRRTLVLLDRRGCCWRCWCWRRRHKRQHVGRVASSKGAWASGRGAGRTTASTHRAAQQAAQGWWPARPPASGQHTSLCCMHTGRLSTVVLRHTGTWRRRRGARWTSAHHHQTSHHQGPARYPARQPTAAAAGAGQAAAPASAAAAPAPAARAAAAAVPH
jgi:hypothetical protein